MKYICESMYQYVLAGDKTVFRGMLKSPSVQMIQDTFNIWKPHHLDKTRRFRTLRYIPVYTGMRFSYWLVLVYTAIYQIGMVYTCIYGIKEMMVFQSLGLCFPVELCRYTLPTYSTTHPGAASAKQSMFYPVELKLGTYMYIQVYTFMIKYIEVYTSQPLFTSNQALSALRCRRVSHPRLSLSSRAAFFLSVVSLTIREFGWRKTFLLILGHVR